MITRNAILLALLSSGVLALPAMTTVTAVSALPSEFRIPSAVKESIQQSRLALAPIGLRRRNWVGNRNEGSCVHASLVNLLHWQGQHELADRWERSHGNGQSWLGLTNDLRSAQVPFAETHASDEAFLDWASRTRRGAVLPYGEGHAVSLIGLNARTATILDPNQPREPFTVSRAAFLQDWKSRGGWAVTPLGTPAAPSPWIVRGVRQ